MKRLTIFALALALAGGTGIESRAQEAPVLAEDALVHENGHGIDDNKVRQERQAHRTALKGLVSELKGSGASRDEIRTAVEEYRAENGIEKRRGKRGGKGFKGGKGCRGKNRHGGRPAECPAGREVSEGAELR